MLTVEYVLASGVKLRTEIANGEATDLLTIPSGVEGNGASLQLMKSRPPSEAETALQYQCEAVILANGQK